MSLRQFLGPMPCDAESGLQGTTISRNRVVLKGVCFHSNISTLSAIWRCEPYLLDHLCLMVRLQGHAVSCRTVSKYKMND